MSLSDIIEVANTCKKLRYEYNVSEKQFHEQPCKKLNCFRHCSVHEYRENIETSGLFKIH
ncbi:hypothetical protein [Methanosarcina mazei]|uniref:hypothetical protein n=1 Tax=Methanosarcina mazei TaxID=2209 RepID=UPI000AA20F76|nr:hypothetical protein [Methanosarcina mazei]